MFSALRARGILRTAATWAVGLSALAVTVLVAGIELQLIPASVFGIRELVAVAIRAFVAGGVAGSLFASLVARREQGRGLAELSYGRLGTSGFLGAATIGAALGLAAPGVLPLSVLIAGTLGLGCIGTGLSIATLALARRAAGLPMMRRLGSVPPASLPPVI